VHIMRRGGACHLFGLVLALADCSARHREATLLSESPKLYSVRQLLTASERQELIRRGEELITLRDRQAGGGKQRKKKAKKVKAASMVHLVGESEALVKRLCRLVGVPFSHAESLAVTRYERGDAYGYHYDSTEGVVTRLVTVLIYLNGSPSVQGGATFFSFAQMMSVVNGTERKHPATYIKTCPSSPASCLLSPAVSEEEAQDAPALARLEQRRSRTTPRLARACTGNSSSGLLVFPQAGDALVLYNHAASPAGMPVLDEHAMHAACPVLDGTKWVAQLWIHATPIQQTHQEWMNHRGVVRHHVDSSQRDICKTIAGTGATVVTI